MPFEARAEKAMNPLSAKLLTLMAKKQTTLCLAADFSNTAKVLELADTVGPYICIFKTHIDVLTDYSEKFISELKQLAHRHNFLLMEDRSVPNIFFFKACVFVVLLYFLN